MKWFQMFMTQLSQGASETDHMLSILLEMPQGKQCGLSGASTHVWNSLSDGNDSQWSEQAFLISLFHSFSAQEYLLLFGIHNKD